MEQKIHIFYQTKTEMTVSNIPCDNLNLVQRWNVLQPAPEVERIILGQGRDVSSRTQQMFNQVGADETVGPGHKNTFALQIHLSERVEIILGRSQEFRSQNAEWAVKHPLPYNEEFDTTSSRTPATPELLQNDMIPEKNRFDRTVLLGLIALEALLFFSFYMREIAWYPPDNFDQASYLIETYRLQERVFANGLGQLWKVFWSQGHAAGVLFPIEGALAGIIIGGTRLPQLCVLFLGFCGLQVAAFTTARAVWQRRVYGYIALGLILSEITLWFSEGGGLFDFRIDFLAYCLYGVWACTVLRSQLFLHRYWSLGCALIGAFLVLNRFVTVAYLLGVSAGFALFCGIIALFWRRDADLVSRMRRRLLNLGLSTALLMVVTVPILLHNWRAIEGYYVVGHAVGEEKYVRAAVAGHQRSAGTSRHFIPNRSSRIIWGRIFLRASAIAIACGLASRLVRRNSREEPAVGRDETFLLQIIFLVGSILGPLLVLTADISKSAVVGGIVGGPTALLVVAVTAFVASRPGQREPILVRRLFAACAVAVFAFGLYNQLSQASRHWPAYAHRDDLKQLDELDKNLVDLANEYGWSHPGVSYDVITGWLNAGPPTISAFEQSRRLIEFQPMLGNGVLGVDRAQAMSLLKQSDFAIFTTLPKKGIYPFYQRISEYWGDLKAWADDNMVVARVVPFSTFTATLYVRPTARILGISGGWITSHGLTLEATRTVLKRFPIVQLTGPADYSHLAKLPAVDATIDAGKSSLNAPASFQRVGSNYEIVIDTSSLSFPPEDDVYIRLDFDSFFVPKAKETENDARELVVKAPELVQLLRP